MIGSKPCGCQAQLEQVNLALREEQRARWDRLDDIAVALKTLAGITTRILRRVEEASGLPGGAPLTIVEAAPAQNTLYTSGQSSINGVARGFVLAGPGNISLYYNAGGNQLSGKILIATLPLNGGAFFLPFRLPVAINDTFSVETDNNSATMLSMATWIDPIALTGSQFYQLNLNR